jgi:hypothetical protein
MLAQDPEVAGSADRLLGRLGDGLFLDRLGRELVEQVVQVVIAEARGGERLIGQGLEQLRQRLVVPLGQLGGTVVGDCEGRRLHLALVHHHAGQVRPAQRPRRLHAPVPGPDDHALALDHQGEPLAEARQRALDGGEVLLVVGAGVGGVEGEVGEGKS